jgi:hypothetical protein
MVDKIEYHYQMKLELKIYSQMTGINYHTLYERYKVGKLMGYSCGGKCYMVNEFPGNYIDILSNYLIYQNKGKVKLEFSLIEVPSSGHNYYEKSYTLQNDLFSVFIRELEELLSFQSYGAVIKITYLPYSETISVPIIHITKFDINNTSIIMNEMGILLRKYHSLFLINPPKTDLDNIVYMLV